MRQRVGGGVTSKVDGRFLAGGAWMLLVMAATLTVPDWRTAIIGAPLPAACLGTALVFLSAIDAQHQRLPDILTLPLLVVGVLLAAVQGWETASSAGLGAVLGYGVVAGLAWYWRTRRGIEGIGLGDAKLLAAGGAWCGVLGLPLILLLASFAGLLYAGLRHFWCASKVSDLSRHRIAFGPFLCAAIWTVWVGALDIITG